MHRIVTIDCYHDELPRLEPGYTVVAVDVIRSTTTAVTALATGRRCLPVESTAEAWRCARMMPGAILAGEQGGDVPPGFEMNNSPAAMHRRTEEMERPVVLLSSSGTKLMRAAALRGFTYCASLRNWRATADWISRAHARVALVGAGTRGEFREEDQIACAWMATHLSRLGFELTASALEYCGRWHGRPLDDIREGKSARYLERSGQQADLEFVMDHVNDLDLVCGLDAEELFVLRPGSRREAAA